MPFIPLDRQFRLWREDKPTKDDFRLFEGSFFGDAGWPELLKRQRVVVLAEAGSGKSKELEEQAKTVAAAGEFAFHATVQNVALHGLIGSVDRTAAVRFDDWQKTESTAWFFIDSVDEAKLDNIRLKDALNRLANDISDGLPRARIILSGRYNNWEFRADLEALERALPVASPRPELPPEPSDALLQLMHNDRASPRGKEVERPLVILMAPLDAKRVRKFAAGQGISDLDAFMSALDVANLWSLAQRPLDLSWLVDYWRKNLRFGHFAEMLETSVRERLREPDAGRARRDALDVDRAVLALERIGATMVFGREVHIELPDPTLSFTQSAPALRLEKILADWTGEHQARLLTRPVFDPASLGRVSLHNDNRGVVRGFLAAKWLCHRLEANASAAAVRDLLFGEADGVPIVLPSVRETAAWMSIWVPEIAREVIHREPGLLLTAGDPDSLSASARTEALQALVAQLAAGDKRYGMLDRDSLRRFANSDLVQAVVKSWQRHKAHEEVRRLLLTLIEAGALKGCAAIAVEAVSGHFGDSSTQLYGARAMSAAASDEQIKTFVEVVKGKPETEDPTLLWEALDLFFPKFLSVEDFLSAVAQNERSAETARDFGWRGRNIIERIETHFELESLLKGLLSEVGPDNPTGDGTEPETSKERRLAPLIQAAASNLIRLTPPQQLDLAVADAAIMLSRGRHHRSSRFEDDNFHAQLTATPERRRAGLWHAVETMQHHPRVVRWGGLVNLSQLEFAGWTPGLKQEDIAWLLSDAREAAAPHRLQLAIDGLFGLWRDAGSPADVLRQIREVAAQDGQTAAMLEARLVPRQLSAEERKINDNIADARQRREIQQKQIDESWVEFVDGLKANPTQLRTPPADLKPGQVDGRLYQIWRLLYDTLPDRNEYAIEDFGELADVFGLELVREAQEALIRFWRSHKPTLTSSRKVNERNQINSFDCMAIAGVSFAAKVDPNWATRLSPAEATIAAQLATLELNGFPSWVKALAIARPEQLRAVFLQEVMDHLGTDASQYGFIDKVKYATPEIAALLTRSMTSYIDDHFEIKDEALAKALALVCKALPVQGLPADFVQSAINRFMAPASNKTGARYIGIVFHAEPALAVKALAEKLDALDPMAQKRLVEGVLPSVFGDRMFHAGVDPKILPFDVLERLVSIALSAIRFEEDNVHRGTFTPDQRDDAEGARGHLFHQLYITPGRPTVEALKRLQKHPTCPIPSERLAGMIHERASDNAERAPWTESEAREMEEEFDTAPRTPRDLQLVALGRIADIDHDLHNAEFSQGQTVKSLPNEREVQKWVANELKQRKRRAYSITREPHVVEEKEPDIRFQSNATDANMPIEIKVAESWTFRQLQAALTTQLVGRYLREQDHHHGILLLVHQKARGRGWKVGKGHLTFAEVVASLQQEADVLASGAKPSYPRIAVIDVSDLEAAPVGPPRKKTN